MHRTRVGLAVLAMLVGITCLGAAPAAGAFDPQQYKKALTKQLQKRGYKVKAVLGCKQVAKGNVACKYQVRGTYTNGPEFGCSGKAVYLKAKKKWRIPLCYNESLWDALLARKLKPKQILSCKQKKGKVNCAFTATGRFTGTTTEYACGGTATYLKKKKTWQIPPCYRALLWDHLLAKNPPVKPVAIVSCLDQGATVRCDWRAAGVWNPGSIPYECSGFGVYTKATKTWSGTNCENKNGDIEPLTATNQPQPDFGFNEDWSEPKAKSLLDQVTKIANDVKIVRLNLPWAVVESARDKYVWTKYEKLYDDFLLAGVKPIWVLQTSPCFAIDLSPCAPGSANLYPPKPSEVGEFVEFAKLAVGKFPNSYAFEVWNEPNGGHFWLGGADPARFGDLVRRTAAGIHDVAPGMKVVAGALAPLSESGEDAIAANNFLRSVYSTGGIGEADAVGYHMYFAQDIKADSIELNARRQIGELRTVMRVYNDGTFPLWLTEFGVDSGVGTDQGGQFTPDGQAGAFSQLYKLLRRMQGIPVTVWHRVLDTKAANADGRDDLRGIFTTQSVKKPIFNTMTSVLGGP